MSVIVGFPDAAALWGRWADHVNQSTHTGYYHLRYKGSRTQHLHQSYHHMSQNPKASKKHTYTIHGLTQALLSAKLTFSNVKYSSDISLKKVKVKLPVQVISPALGQPAPNHGKLILIIFGLFLNIINTPSLE